MAIRSIKEFDNSSTLRKIRICTLESKSIPQSSERPDALFEKWFQLRRHFWVANVSVRESASVCMVRSWIDKLWPPALSFENGSWISFVELMKSLVCQGR